MRKLLQLAAIMVLIAGVNIYSQTTVNPGEGTLSAAIAAANSGDVLQLVPGATYTESTLFNLGTIHKALTIELADPSSTDKAIVQILSNDGTSTPNFFMVGDSGALTLSDIEFDGNQNSKATASHLIQFTAGTNAAPGMKVGTIKITNCYIHDLVGNVIDGGSSSLAGNLVVDSVICDNDVFKNTFTSVYLKYAGANYVQLTNSTFYNMNSYGVRISGPSSTLVPNDPTVIVDHTTWNNIGGTDQREILLLDGDSNPAEWTVTNSIFANQTSTSKTVINIKNLVDTTKGVVTNICMWEVGARKWNKNTVQDTITMDPQFADAANGDFTLPKGSKLLTFGTDGGPIGDPRWATNATAVMTNSKAQPARFELAQNYPNPFNPSTKINFSIQKSGMTNLVVYNILGKEVATLVKGNLTAGQHTVNFNAVNLPSGVYIYRLSTSSQTISKKMILIK